MSEVRDLYLGFNDGRKVLIYPDMAQEDLGPFMEKYVKRLSPEYGQYFRAWDIKDGVTQYDFGSWTLFFYWGNDDF